MENLTFKNSTVVKNYSLEKTNHSIQEWHNLYQCYCAHEARAVKVVSASVKNKNFTMERLDGFVLSDSAKVYRLPWQERFYIISEITSIFSKFWTFEHPNLRENQRFIHLDLHTPNFFYTTDKELKLIDPDSFQIVNMNTPQRVLYGRYFDTLQYLKECLNTYR